MDPEGRRNGGSGRGRGRNSGNNRGDSRGRGRQRTAQHSNSAGRSSGAFGGPQSPSPPPGLHARATQRSEAALSSSAPTDGWHIPEEGHFAQHGSSSGQGVSIPSNNNSRRRSSYDRDSRQGSHSRGRNSRYSSTPPVQNSPNTSMRQNNVVPIPSSFFSNTASRSMPDNAAENFQPRRHYHNKSRHADASGMYCNCLLLVVLEGLSKTYPQRHTITCPHIQLRLCCNVDNYAMKCYRGSFASQASSPSLTSV